MAVGYQTDPPKSATYESVVLRESAHVALLLVELGDIDILSAEIQYAHLNAPFKEKVWFRYGEEFGFGKGIVINILRLMYGMKLTGASRK